MSELYHHGVKGMKWGVRKSIAKTEKRRFKRDVEEYRKLRSDFGRSLSKSVSRKTQDLDRQANTAKLLKVKDYVENKRIQKGSAYVDELIKRADRKDNAKSRIVGGAFIATGVAATAGLAWLQAKYDI